RGRKIVSERIMSLGDRVKRIHTDGFIIAGNTTDLTTGMQTGELKIVNSGNVAIKNVMNFRWINSEKANYEILAESEKQKAASKYIVLPNELLTKIFLYISTDKDVKTHPLLFVNKQWSENARRLIWQEINLTSISGAKFTTVISNDTKLSSCAYVTAMKFSGKINLAPGVFISEVCKACPNLHKLVFEHCGSRMVNNRNIEALLADCKNIQSVTIIGSDRISSKTIIKIPQLSLSLKVLKIKECFRIN